MAQVLAGNKIRLDDGKLVDAQAGGWYDGQQFWEGSLGAVNVINNPNQVGYNQQVSPEVRAQSAQAQGVTPQQFDQYLAGQAQKTGGAFDPNVNSVAAMSGGMAGGGVPGGSMAGGISAPQTPDLKGIYDAAYESAGISTMQSEYDTIQAEINARAEALAQKEGEINENPYYAEATRTGRIAKLQEQAQKDINNLINKQKTVLDKINMARADIETQLGLATKQFDINSQASQQALSQFNTLLSTGALNNASADDLIAFSAQTGIPPSFLQSAVQSSQAKDRQTQLVTSTDDFGNVTLTLVDTQTGEVINSKGLGAVGNNTSGSGGGGTTTPAKQVQANFYTDVESNIQEADLFPRLVQAYAPALSLQDIYRLYSTSTAGEYYGTPTEDPAAIKSIYDQFRGN